MQVMEYFKTLCAIAHCSHEAGAMLVYLEAQAMAYGYATERDASGNLLCTHPKSRVTLQAHYDMVCIGRAPQIETYESDGWLYAKESSLGADNAIAMAMMLALMNENTPVDLLFTADEEVGLLGARDLGVTLKTPYMLNLDSESENVVTVGCAGGVDIIATLPLHYRRVESGVCTLHVKDLPGGHSGLDIDKGVPSAIRELLKQCGDGMLMDITGGERRNSIPKAASARLTCNMPPFQSVDVIEESSQILDMLENAPHGVIARDAKGGVLSSVNLAMVAIEAGVLHVHLSARAMRGDALESLREETKAYFRSFGCDVRDEGWYDPWEAEENDWSRHVAACIASVSGHVSVETIHAGLECGVIKSQFSNIQMASIGPNIHAPHSVREGVEIASVARVFESVKKIIAL